MANTIIITWVTLGVFCLLVAMMAVCKLVLYLMKGPLTTRIAERYEPSEIVLQDVGANSFGLESAGVRQLRGNGALVLTDRFLHFFQFLPKREVCISLGSITEVFLARSHLHKSVWRSLLKVRFTSNGQPDSIAWYVAQPEEWKNRLEDLLVAKRGHS